MGLCESSSGSWKFRGNFGHGLIVRVDASPHTYGERNRRRDREREREIYLYIYIYIYIYMLQLLPQEHLWRVRGVEMIV